MTKKDLDKTQKLTPEMIQAAQEASRLSDDDTLSLPSSVVEALRRESGDDATKFIPADIAARARKMTENNNDQTRIMSAEMVDAARRESALENDTTQFMATEQRDQLLAAAQTPEDSTLETNMEVIVDDDMSSRTALVTQDPKELALQMPIFMNNLPEAFEPVKEELVKTLIPLLRFLKHYGVPENAPFELMVTTTELTKAMPVEELTALSAAIDSASNKDIQGLFNQNGLNPDYIIGLLEVFPKVKKQLSATIKGLLNEIVNNGGLQQGRPQLSSRVNVSLVEMEHSLSDGRVSIDFSKLPERDIKELILFLAYTCSALVESARNRAPQINQHLSYYLRDDLNQPVSEEVAKMIPTLTNLVILLSLQATFNKAIMPMVESLLDKLDYERLIATIENGITRYKADLKSPTPHNPPATNQKYIETFEEYLRLIRQVQALSRLMKLN